MGPILRENDATDFIKPMGLFPTTFFVIFNYFWPNFRFLYKSYYIFPLYYKKISSKIIYKFKININNRSNPVKMQLGGNSLETPRCSWAVILYNPQDAVGRWFLKLPREHPSGNAIREIKKTRFASFFLISFPWESVHRECDPPHPRIIYMKYIYIYISGIIINTYGLIGLLYKNNGFNI